MFHRPGDSLKAHRLAHALTMRCIVLGLAMVIEIPSAEATSASDPLAAHRWRSRVLVVFARSADDSRLTEQKQLIASMGTGAEKRDLVLVEVIGSTSQAQLMRSHLGASDEEFAVVLVGKDGGPKLSSSQPIAADELMRTIDAMPMRQREAQRR